MHPWACSRQLEMLARRRSKGKCKFNFGLHLTSETSTLGLSSLSLLLLDAATDITPDEIARSLLDEVFVAHALLGGHALEHALDAWHHALEAAEVDVRALVKLGEDLVREFLHLVLNVHLAARSVGLLARQGKVVAEVAGELLLDLAELVIVQQGVGVGHTEEEPGLALVRLAGRRLLDEEAAEEATVGRDAGSGGDHDEVGGRVLLGHEHDLSGRAGHGHLGARGGVAEVVGADALLGRVLGAHLRVPVHGAAHAERAGVAGHVVAVAAGRDGVQADAVRLAVLGVGAGRDDAPGLALPEGHAAAVLDDDVAGLAGGLLTHNALHAEHLALERVLVLVRVHGDGALVPVRLGLQEVLRLGRGLGERRAVRAGEKVGRVLVASSPSRAASQRAAVHKLSVLLHARSTSLPQHVWDPKEPPRFPRHSRD
eukprot:scaffold1659_cov255-Pinguiococcus_pyrenoidosus.AAC.2